MVNYLPHHRDLKLMKIISLSTICHQTAFNLWLACNTQEEIAGAVEVSREAVSDWIADFGKMSAADNLPNSPDFEVPQYPLPAKPLGRFVNSCK